jgi:DNA invertase Pin-like site-specific DNA recombinase
MPHKTEIRDVALYARVSTRDGRQDTENQLVQLREYCRKRGWTIVAEYIDHESGGTPQRPKFQQMFQDANRRRFDLLLFWSLDRLSREGVLETLKHLERLTHCGVNWKSYTEQYLDSIGPFRDAVVSILAAIANQERVRRSERAKAAIERLRQQGRTDHLGRPRLMVDREKVKRLRRQGLSVRQIAAKLNISPATTHRIVQAIRLERS